MTTSEAGDLAELAEHREAVAAACRRLAAAGMAPGTAGNVSARSGALVAITPTGAALADLAGNLVSVVDLDGRLVAGDLQPTSEVQLHMGVYRRFGAGAVVHTHAAASTAVACVLEELPCVHYQMLVLGGPVRVAPYATFGTQELADSVLDALEGRSAALMANHGAVTYAGSVDKAYELMEVLEWACAVYQKAASLGEPRLLTQEQVDAVIVAAVERGYGSTHSAVRTDAVKATGEENTT